MIYLPSQYINSDYTYYIDSNRIIIQEELGQCRDVYINNDYIVSDTYTCDYVLPTISVDKFTDSYFYRLDIAQILFILFSLLGVGILVFKSLFNALFRRFKQLVRCFMEKRNFDIPYMDLYHYKLRVYYTDSKVYRTFYFISIFSLFHFICFIFKKKNVDFIKVVKL